MNLLSKINLSFYLKGNFGYDEINDFSVRILKINSDVQLARRQLNDLYSAMKPELHMFLIYSMT